MGDLLAPRQRRIHWKICWYDEAPCTNSRDTARLIRLTLTWAALLGEGPSRFEAVFPLIPLANFDSMTPMWAISTQLEAGSSEESRDAVLSIAVCQMDITPDYGANWLCGYGWGKGGVTPIEAPSGRPLRAQCLVVWDRGTPNIMLRLDVANITRGVNQRLRDRLRDENLITEKADFIILSSHTHKGPYLAYGHLDEYTLIDLTDEEIDMVIDWTEALIDNLVSLVRQSLGIAPVPVTMHFGEETVEPSISAVRGGTNGTPLSKVQVLVARSMMGRAVAVLFGFACHSTFSRDPRGEATNRTYDSDFCGLASQSLESPENELAVPAALFFQGAAGDLVSNGTLALAGEEVAKAVRSILAKPEQDLQPVTGPLRNSYVEINLPLMVDLAVPEERSRLRGEYQNRIDSGRFTVENGLAQVKRHAQKMVGNLDDPAYWSVPTPLQCWRFTGLTILAMAHEVSSQYARQLEPYAGESRLWVMGYANETEIYLPDHEGLLKAGYNSGWSESEGQNVAAIDPSSLIPYTWPCPLKLVPRDQPVPVQPIGLRDAPMDTAPRIVWDICVELLQS